YKGQDDARVIKLIEGEHLLTFDMDDGRGKISSQSFRITVMPQKKNTASMVTVTVMLLLIIMTISVYRKLKVRRAGKAVSRHE
ncbi:MAG: hypothetical protein II126_02700, partial [Erysipelotrichaceae bacterium]|nr:hypothetical protein [Erysipelotrichaceae bacterium]